MIVYPGTGFLLIGIVVFFISATSTSAEVLLALGVIIFAIGIFLSYLGVKSRNDKAQSVPVPESDVSAFLRSYVQLERSQQHQKAARPNKAFGFVLLSRGALCWLGVYLALV